MNGRRSYKTDESFLEKLAIGAIGTKAVFDNLAVQEHDPIELERGSMSYKIWKEIKIKRVRVPDILCVKCDRRVESRAKTKMEISMSHSMSTPERGWDYGLKDEDYIAFVQCVKAGDRPINWFAQGLPQYVPVSAMRAAYNNNLAFSERPKGAQEGFEVRVIWPSTIASSDGTVVAVSSERLQYRRADSGRLVTLGLGKRGTRLFSLVRPGQVIHKGQVMASVVPIHEAFECLPKTSEQYFIGMLHSTSLSDRYVAAKALSAFASDETRKALLNTMTDGREHIYVQLEAAGSLIKAGFSESVEFFESLLNDRYLENRLECVIVLSEIDRQESRDLLVTALLDSQQHPEIRAGAAWSLGELAREDALEPLVQAFNEVSFGIRAEAARALVKLANASSSGRMINIFPERNEEERAGIAWALSKSGRFSVQDLIPAMTDDSARQWIAWVLGTQDEVKYVQEIEKLRQQDGEVYFAVTLLWKILLSWVSSLELY